jgi:uncharacterized protein YegL
MKNYTDLTFVIDRSGSMGSIAEDMEGGFATFIKDQKETKDDVRVSVVYFDDKYDVAFTTRPIAEVDKIVITPRGSTALIDALGRTIDAIGVRLAALDEKERPNRVLVMTITDGQENASREFTLDEVKEKIKLQREVYAWDFSFLGANIDSFTAGAGLGIAKGSTRNFAATKVGVAEAWAANTCSFESYKMLDRSVDRGATFAYVDAEKK